MASKTRLMQSTWYNRGQPEGFDRTVCPKCNGSGSGGGSKCTTCAGYGVYYQKQKEESDG